MTLEDIMLSEGSQSQKDRCYMSPFTWVQSSNFQTQRVEWRVGAGRRGSGELVLHGNRVSILQD
jgi:hypothetical protein